MKITTYKYEKVPVKDTEIFIPTEPFYCFQTGVRRSIRMVPIYITEYSGPFHKIGDIYELEVTCIYQSFECIIEKFNVRLSNMEDHINRNEKSKAADITRMLLDGDYHKRTEEQFNTDLKSVLFSLGIEQGCIVGATWQAQQEPVNVDEPEKPKTIKVTFGIQPIQIQRIESEIKRWDDMIEDGDSLKPGWRKYDKDFWDRMGEEFGWCPTTLALYYFKSQSQPKEPKVGELWMCSEFDLPVVIVQLLGSGGYLIRCDNGFQPKVSKTELLHLATQQEVAAYIKEQYQDKIDKLVEKQQSLEIYGERYYKVSEVDYLMKQLKTNLNEGN